MNMGRIAFASVDKLFHCQFRSFISVAPVCIIPGKSYFINCSALSIQTTKKPPEGGKGSGPAKTGPVFNDLSRQFRGQLLQEAVYCFMRYGLLPVCKL